MTDSPAGWIPRAAPTRILSAVRPLRLLGVVAVLTVVGCAGAAERRDAPAAGSRTDDPPAPTTTCAADDKAFVGRLGEIERDNDAVVGVYAVDTGTGDELAHRGDERFAFASTIKALAAAVVLDRLSTRQLSDRLSWTRSDLVPHSPVTERHLDDGLTVRQVLEAAVTVSDNTAANLLLELLGGPRALDRALAEMGDSTTEVVRREPDLNDYTPGDVRDTTTPRAIASSLRAFAVGDVLGVGDRRLLNDLLQRNTTGDTLVRAGVPHGWKVRDKTGSASYGTRNDIAVVTPPGGTPLVLAVLTRRLTVDAPTDDALVAEATKAVVEALCR